MQQNIQLQIIDFDIATNYKNSQGESVNSLNLAIVNYSENFLSDKLTKAIKTYNPSTDLNNRYKKVPEVHIMNKSVKKWTIEK